MRISEIPQAASGAVGQAPWEPSRRPGLTIAVFSTKGGVGTTTVAINLAATFAAVRPARSVVLVDLVLQHGDIATLLDAPISHTVATLAQQLGRADEHYVRSVIPQHAAGMAVLPAPSTADEGELVTAGQVKGLLDLLRTFYDVVVLDLGNELVDPTLAALDAADRIVLVALPDLASIRNTRRGLDLFERMQYDPAKSMIVLNRSTSHERLGQQMVEAALGRPVQWSIPNDYRAVVEAVNGATTVRQGVRGQRLASNFEGFVHACLQTSPSAAPPRRRTGWFRDFGRTR